MVRRTLLGVLMLAALMAPPASADPHACRRAEPETWSALERAVWQAATANAPFDAARYSADARERVLEAAFLGTLLTCEALHETLPDRGVELRGVLVSEPLDLRFAEVGVRFACRGCVLRSVDAAASRWRRPLELTATAVQGEVTFADAVFDDLVSLRGLRAPAGLRLDDVRVARSLDLGELAQTAAVAMAGARVGDALAFDGARVAELVLDEAAIGGTLSGRGSVVDGDLVLRAVDVGRSLDLRFTQVAGSVSLRDARLGGKARLDGARAEALDLSHARIGDQLILSGIHVEDAVVLDKLRTGSDLLLRSWPDGPRPVLGAARAVEPAPTDFDDPVLDLDNADIGGRIDIAWAELRGAVSFDAVRVAEDIWMRDCTVVHGPLRMPFARIGQNVDLSTTALGDLNATAVTIGGELRLGIPGTERFTPPVWRPGATLRLRNAGAPSWVDRDDGAPRWSACEAASGDPTWPETIDVIGFDYAGLGGLGGGAIEARPAAWFTGWLDRQKPVSLEPYQRLAAVLRAAGHDRKAREVLYAGKQRMLDAAEPGLRRFVLWLQKIFVGFGVYKETILIWVAVMTVVGWLVVRRTPQARRVEPPLDLVYSFDSLIQLVHLRPEAKDIQFEGFARWYMYAHRFMGWVLGGFLLAAFAGLFGT